MTIALPLWVWFASVVFGAWSLHVLAQHLYRWLLRDAGPWGGKRCPVCQRPHEYEARELQRQLREMDEKYDRLDRQAYAASYEMMEAMGAALPEVWQDRVREDKRVCVALAAWTKVHNHGAQS